MGRHHVVRDAAGVIPVLTDDNSDQILGCGSKLDRRASELLPALQDSFKSCTTFPAALHVLQILAPDLVARLHEDHQVSRSVTCPNIMYIFNTSCLVSTQGNWPLHFPHLGGLRFLNSLEILAVPARGLLQTYSLGRSVHAPLVQYTRSQHNAGAHQVAKHHDTEVAPEEARLVPLLCFHTHASPGVASAASSLLYLLSSTWRTACLSPE